MKAKILMRINMLLGAAIVTLLGMSGCERPVVKYGIPEVKYGSPDSTLIVPMYGVTPPQVSPELEN